MLICKINSSMESPWRLTKKQEIKSAIVLLDGQL